MQFLLLDFKMCDTCDTPHPINFATLPCESRNTENARGHNISF